jgi:hypothetical protein
MQSRESQRTGQPTDAGSTEMEGIVYLGIGLGVLAVVLWPGFFTATLGGALTGGGSWLLKKAFGK